MVFYKSSLSASLRKECLKLYGAIKECLKLYGAILEGLAGAAAELLKRMPQWMFAILAIVSVIAIGVVSPLATLGVAALTESILMSSFFVIGGFVAYTHWVYMIILITEEFDRKNSAI